MTRKRQIVRWTLAILGVLLIAGFVGGYLFLRSASLQQYALRKIIESVNEATGGRAEIRHLDFQLSTLTAHLYDVTLHGTEAPSDPPLAHLDKLTVGIKIRSLLRRQITLSELEIEHPVVHVRVDRNGKSNIPQSSHQSSGSKTGSNTSGRNISVFDLAARHVLLSNGEINYNDAETPLDAELYGLRTEIHFDWLATRYSGSISYDNGRLHYAKQAPVSHSLQAAFSATPSRFSLDSALLKVGSSSLSLHADLANYGDPTVDGRYDLRLHAADFAAMSQPLTPAGDVSLSGSIHYQNSNQPLMRAIAIDGEIISDKLTVSAAQGQIDIRRLNGKYQLANGALQAHGVALESLGGQVTTDIDIEHLDTTATVRVRSNVKGISLQSAQHSLRGMEVQNVTVSGRIDGSAQASWTGNIGNMRAGADLTLRAPANSATQRSSIIPVNGVIHATYDGPKNNIAFRQTTLRIPSATISAQGEVSNHSNLQIQASASDLHQLAVLVAGFNSTHAAPMEVTGSVSLRATVQGPSQKPVIAGEFTAKNLQVQGSEWTSATSKFRASASEVALQNASLVNAHQGKATLSANVGLQNWSYQPSSPITLNLSVQRMAIADLQRLANSKYPVSGDLSAEVSLHGSQLSPSGSGNAKIDNARAYGEPIQHLAATFHADKSSMSSTLDVSLPAGAANGSVSYTPKTKAYTVRLNAPSIVLQKLQTVQKKNLAIAGTLTLSASGQGTLDNPQLVATIAVPRLQLRDKAISQIRGAINVANQRAEVTFDSAVAQASVHSRGTVNLTGDYETEATIDTNSVPLDPLLAMFTTSLPQGFQGETELHGTVKGPLKDKSRIEAHLTIPTLKARYQSLEIGAASPIRVDYSHSVITLEPAEIRGTDTSVRLQGSYPLDGNSSATLSAQGSVDVGIVRIFQPDTTGAGTLTLDIHASGTAKNPAVQGQIQLKDVAFSSPTAPLGVQKLNGTFDVNNDSIHLSNVAGEVGGGQLSMGGSISYRPNLQFNLTMQSMSVRLLYPDGLRTVLDGNLLLSGTRDAATLNGRVLIDSLSFTPDFDLTKFVGQFGGATVPSQPGLADNIKLAVSVQSKGSLNANSSQLTIAGQVNLQVIGTAANPVIIGRTNLTSGELFYRNVRYQIDRGIITFDNPNETHPVINVSASTTIQQYNLTLTMRGTFDKLETSYTSDPPLATADVINLIAQGKTTQQQSAQSQSTDSMIASQVTSQLTGSVQHLAGISALQIDPLIGGNNQNPSARVAIQQRVTKNFLFTFSTDLSQPGTEVVQGDYQISKRWSVSLSRNEVGGVSIDGKYHTRF